MSIDEPRKRKRGRPPVESDLIRTRVTQPMLGYLDAWIAAQPDPKPSRPDAIRLALKDWLTGLGIMHHREDPEGAN